MNQIIVTQIRQLGVWSGELAKLFCLALKTWLGWNRRGYGRVRIVGRDRPRSNLVRPRGLSRKWLIGCLILAISGCKSQSATPTLPALDGYPAPAAASAMCQDWSKAKPALGQILCVKGVVVKSQVVDNNFVMKFDESDTSIYGVAHGSFYFGIDGHCAQITGEVSQDDKGRFFLQADVPGQITECAP